MKMTTAKIPNRAELEAFAKTLAGLLAAAKGGVEKLEALAETLTNEIAQEEETLDATNRAAVEQLAAKKTQLALLQKQIEREADKADAKYLALRQHLTNFREVWCQALQQEYRDAIERVAELDQIAPEQQGQAEVMSKRWVIYEAAGWIKKRDALCPPIRKPIGKLLLRVVRAFGRVCVALLREGWKQLRGRIGVKK
jgi:hypothetical protein